MGETDGPVEGDSDGLVEGEADGTDVGDEVGLTLGEAEGDKDGLLVGDEDGLALGGAEGLAVGDAEGLAVEGLAEGDEVGGDDKQVPHVAGHTALMFGSSSHSLVLLMLMHGSRPSIDPLRVSWLHVGAAVGAVGLEEGDTLGEADGASVGAVDGDSEGPSEGDTDGVSVVHTPHLTGHWTLFGPAQKLAGASAQ